MGRDRVAINYTDGKDASTRFTVQATGPDGALLLLCVLEEFGRTHQIRIHAKHAGFPIVGDIVYGASESEASLISRVALHAWRLRVEHPQSRNVLLFEATMQADLQACLD